MKDKKTEKEKNYRVNNSPLLNELKDEAFIDPSYNTFEHWKECFLVKLLNYVDDMDKHFERSRIAFFKCYEHFQEMGEDLKIFTPMRYYFDHVESYDELVDRIEEVKANYEIKAPYPLHKRKIQPLVARNIFTGMYLNKKESGTYNDFRDFYNSNEVQYQWFTRGLEGIDSSIDLSKINPSDSPVYLPTIPERPKKFEDKHKTKKTLKGIIFENCLVNTSCLSSKDRADYLELFKPNLSVE